MKKNRKNNTVWEFPYHKTYYLKHPWKWFKQLWRTFHAAWSRCTNGWCSWDVWDWDIWFAHTVPPMLRHMADQGSAYPGYEPFDTPEKWHDWLHNIANMIETSTEEWQDEHNEYYEKYTNSWDKELRIKYMQRAEELAKQGERNIRYAFENLGKYFYNLWD